MAVYKETVEILTTWFNGHGNINEVTFGNEQQVDITSETDFPLVHIMPQKTLYGESQTEINFKIKVLTTYESDEEELIDVLDMTHAVFVDFVRDLWNGALFSALIRVSTDPIAEVVYDEHNNRLYGHTLDIKLKMPPTISNCS